MLALVLLSGCASGSAGAHVGEKFAVNTQRTLFFKFGPAQTTGPDFALYKGQRVTMLSYQFGYSHVATDDGQSGYVSTDDITAAPPDPKAPATSATTRGGRPVRRERAPTREEQARVPLPDLPDRKPHPGSPGFRY